MSSDIDFSLVKAANKKTKYTPAQVREFALCANNPLYFMEKFMWIQHPTKGKIPFEAYDFQKRMIECYWKNNSAIALLPRQAGKCVINTTIITIKQNSTGEIYDIQLGHIMNGQHVYNEVTLPLTSVNIKGKNNKILKYCDYCKNQFETNCYAPAKTCSKDCKYK